MPASGNLVKRILATATIAIAAITALIALAPPLSVSMIFIALGLFIPGAWWFYCESKDKKTKAEHEQSVQAQSHWKEHLDPFKDQAVLAGLAAPFDGPRLFQRRWGWVFLSSFAAFAIAVILTPEVPAASQTNETKETSLVTTTPSESTTSTTTSSSSTSTTTTELLSTSSSTTHAPEPTEQQPTEEPYVEETYVEQRQFHTPAPEPTPAPQQFVQQPAAPIVQESPSVYYQNCDAVRAAGAAPLYIGSPGYAPKLDRDGDGIACE